MRLQTKLIQSYTASLQERTSSQIETKSFRIITILRHPVITGHRLINDMIKYQRTLSQEYFSVVALWQKLIQDIDNLTPYSFLRLRSFCHPTINNSLRFSVSVLYSSFAASFTRFSSSAVRCSFLRRSNSSNSASDNSSLI